MIRDFHVPTRRQFLGTMSTASAGLLAGSALQAKGAARGKAQIAITLDLEMSRNFPNRKDLHWDYEKGNLNQAAKDYTVAACKRVKNRGGVIHNFVVGQVFEQPNVDWLKEIADGGHPIGNHTYDHIYLLAKTTDQLQFRFQRAPWLLGDRDVHTIIRDNIKLTNMALKERVGVEANGFRTPGGFADGLNSREDIQQIILDTGFDWVSCRYPAHAGIKDLYNTGQTPSQEAYSNILKAQPEAQPFMYPTDLLEIPMSPISDIGAFRTGRWKLDYFKEAVRMAMDWAIENGGVYDFLAHPSCLGVVDPGFETIDMICDIVQRSDGMAEIVSLDTIAKRFRNVVKS